MSLTADRNTPQRSGHSLPLPVAADALIYAGALVCVNADGFAIPGKTGTGLAYAGRAEERIDNTDGANGDCKVMVRIGDAFLWENSSTDAVTATSLMRDCYVEDDCTVAGTAGESAKSVAGLVIGIDDDGVWVAPKY